VSCSGGRTPLKNARRSAGKGEWLDVWQVLGSKPYLCSCPFGEHAARVVAEAESANDALVSVGPVTRAHHRAIQVEVVNF